MEYKNPIHSNILEIFFSTKKQQNVIFIIWRLDHSFPGRYNSHYFERNIQNHFTLFLNVQDNEILSHFTIHLT